MPLRLRLVLAIAAALLATLSIGGIAAYWHAAQKVETEMQAALTVGGQIARNGLADAGAAGEAERRLRLLVANFDGGRHLRAKVMGVDGTVALASSPQPPEVTPPGWVYRLCAGVTKKLEIKLPATAAPFDRIVLEADPLNEVAEVWSDAKLFMGILAVFCGLGAVALYVLIGRALKPLGDLNTAFDHIGKGAFGPPLPLSSTREIAQLTQGFNAMVERLAQAEERNRRLRVQLETVQEEERVELARNLHDEVSPLLFLIDVDAMAIAEKARAGGNNDVMEKARAIQSAIAEVKTNVKTVLHQLRPGGNAALGLKSTIENLIAAWQSRNQGVSFTLDIPEKSFGAHIDNAVFNIVRESLSNVMKHAGANEIAIGVRENNGCVRLCVHDNGKGLQTPGADGLGILGMRERAALLGGSLKVESRPGMTGVAVTAELPVGGSGLDEGGRA